ncbi:phytanoyl-CoA dioxygenase family protein [Flavobacterium psychrotrophum]|uniref:phytanoyl-CoA dioxygenase family protein n=1 Tax=Flavobacterium psychrotrophum TaxID=2294119 RepID=UPI000E31FE83|nr:phytanoyl-CoA dioxygenase family protein [Flavobacterium psychrotrophum]
MDFRLHKKAIDELGFSIIDDIYSDVERNAIINIIEGADTSGDTFRKSANLFAIRQFLKEIPRAASLIFNKKLNEVIRTIFGADYFVIKSIYFDKPGDSNWFVSYHQDLTISVKDKIETPGYGPWTIKQNQFAVQPPLPVLENIYTIRIHLDDTNEDNGALKIVPKSHAKGIYRPETIDWNAETEVNCSVKAGGIMLMKPLLLHSSTRSVNNNRRRVIHIELSNTVLADGLQWAELID